MVDSFLDDASDNFGDSDAASLCFGGEPCQHGGRETDLETLHSWSVRLVDGCEGGDFLTAQGHSTTMEPSP